MQEGGAGLAQVTQVHLDTQGRGGEFLAAAPANHLGQPNRSVRDASAQAGTRISLSVSVAIKCARVQALLLCNLAACWAPWKVLSNYIKYRRTGAGVVAHG